MGARLEFAILGPLEVRRGGAPVAIGGPRQRALLVLLLCHANRVVSRDRLIAELMDERAVEDGDHALRVQISRLRKALDGDGQRLLTRAPGYLLRVEPEELDLRAFEDRVAQAREQADPAQAVALLRRAEELWRGPPLAGLEPGPSTRVEVQRLEELRLLATEDRVDAELSLGRHGALCPELEALVAEHPLRERLRAQLMLALYRAGRQAEALAVYRDGRTRLVEELALEPGPQLRRLERAILLHDPALELDGERPAPAPEAPARSSRRHRPALAGGVVAALAAAAAIVPALGGAPRPPHPMRGNGLALVTGDAIRARVRLTAAPSDVSAGFGALWVAEPSEGIVERVDPRRRRVVATIPVGRRPSPVLAAAGQVWVLDPRDRALSRIDPATDTVARTITVGRDPTGLAAGAGSLWVANHGDGTVWRIAPRTGRIRAIRAGTAPRGLAATPRDVWVTDDQAGSVMRIEAATDAVTAHIHVGDAPAAVVASGTDVWVVDPLDATLSRIDARRDAVTETIPLAGEPGGVSLSGGAVWVADEHTGRLLRLPAGRPIDVCGRPVALTTAGGLWTAIAARGPSHSGGTLTMLPSSLEVDTIDPAASNALNISPTSLLGLTNDGLVTLNHATGPGGSRLVPDLAVSLPPPRDHDRLYAFRLRPYIRYSTGAPVRATDVRHSFERIFAMGSSAADNYLAIAGAAHCRRRPVRCDLSRGIATDDRAGTVTFRLTRPDPDFEAKLALIYAAVLPASAPRREARTPLPATGPYMIERYLPAHELRLVRNPRFREWSAAAQPAGYPDAIVLRFDLPGAAGTAAVAAGRADLVQNIGGAAMPRGAQRARLRSDPLAGTQFLFLNVAVPPFDDVRVRRALNLALDRGRIVRLDGGRGAAQATCQVLPPQLPGYRPYCPYTRRPTRDGRWHGPDLRRARRLVAAARTRGMKVGVWDTREPPFAVNEGRVAVAALRRLGYRATLHLLPDSTYFSYVNDSRNRAQVIDGGWGVDYPATDGFLSRLTCRSFVPADAPATTDASEFCDPAVDRRIAHAAALQTTDRTAAVALWRRLDRDLTDRAIWLPTTIAAETDLLSRRAGDYRYNPLSGVLLDQLWVR